MAPDVDYLRQASKSHPFTDYNQEGHSNGTLGEIGKTVEAFLISVS